MRYLEEATRTADRLLTSLGMNPTSRARLGADLGLMEAVAVGRQRFDAWSDEEIKRYLLAAEDECRRAKEAERG